MFVANDFGRKNLYRQDGCVNGQPHFTDVAAPAGVEDYGAGMSAAFLDYDNDGHLDIYAGNMWTAAGQRITAAPGFKPDASPEIKAIYRQHARGNSLFKNRGDGTFADVTLEAGAEFGRWAWASDAFDFDSDGWQDLYVVNGMFTRDEGEPGVDVDSFFWRQVVAQSPLERQPGTSYDDGWRATNRLLVSNGAQAQHERNVLLRNNGRGGFDDVSGSTGLDIDQDGRSFVVSDFDADGDPDIVLHAPRSSPQLRLFRNDFAAGHASLALRLTGTKSNRDAVGARVTVDVEGDGRRISGITRIVTAGSGFLSQHSKELLIGVGATTVRTVKATIVWPSGLVQILPSLPIGHRVWVEEGKDAVRTEPFHKASAPGSDALSSVSVDPARRAKSGTWLYQPVPSPDFTLRDLDGQEHSLSGMTGRPILLSFWASSASSSRATLAELSRLRDPLTKAGASLLAISVDPASEQAKVRAAVQGLGLTVAIAGDEVAGTWNILHRYLFDRREDLPLPTAFLINARGEIAKIYKGSLAGAAIVDDVMAAMKSDVSPADRLARAAPFPGVFTSQPGRRNEFQYGLELSEQGFDAPALVVFERVAQGDPSAIAFSNLGTLYMKGGRPSEAKAAFERALALDPKFADAHNTLGALLAQSGDLPGCGQALPIGPRREGAVSGCDEQSRIRPLPDGAATRSLRPVSTRARAAARLSRGAQQRRHLLRSAAGSRAGRALLPSGVRAASHLRRSREQPGAPARRARRSGRGDRGARTAVEGQSGVRAGLRHAMPPVCGGRPAARGPPRAGAPAPAQSHASAGTPDAETASARTVIGDTKTFCDRQPQSPMMCTTTVRVCGAVRCSQR